MIWLVCSWTQEVGKSVNIKSNEKMNWINLHNLHNSLFPEKGQKIIANVHLFLLAIYPNFIYTFQLLGGTSTSETRFKSNLLGGLGAGIFVGPNTIDFGSVFTAEKFLEAVAVFVTVVSIIVIFIPLAVICRRYDAKDKMKVCFIYIYIYINTCPGIGILLCFFSFCPI